MKNNYIFGVDMDTVMTDWEGEGSMMPKIWQERFPNSPYINCKNAKHWFIEENYPVELRSSIREIYKNPEPGFYRTLPKMEGLDNGLLQLIQNARIIIVSTPLAARLFNTSNYDECKEYVRRYNNVVKEKNEWLEEHVAPVVGFMPETLFVQDKSTACCHVLIDDNPGVKDHTAIEPVWEHVLFDNDFGFNKQVQNHYKTNWTDPELVQKVLAAAKSSRI